MNYTNKTTIRLCKTCCRGTCPMLVMALTISYKDKIQEISRVKLYTTQ